MTIIVSETRGIVRLVFAIYWSKVLEEKATKVSKSAFEPRPDDDTGLSVFSLEELGDPRNALNCMPAEKRDQYGAVRIDRSVFEQLGLQIEKDDVDCAEGHALVTNLNSDLLTDRGKLKSYTKRLADESVELFRPNAQ